VIRVAPPGLRDGLILLADGKPIEAVIGSSSGKGRPHIGPPRCGLQLADPREPGPLPLINRRSKCSKPCSRRAGQWRVFLHPSQRSCGSTLERSGEGAGWCRYWQNRCGHASHRWLAHALADAVSPGRVCVEPPSRASSTTDIRSNLTKICKSTEALQRIEVHIIFDGLVMNCLKNQEPAGFGCLTHQAGDSCWAWPGCRPDTTLGLGMRTSTQARSGRQVGLANGGRTPR